MSSDPRILIIGGGVIGGSVLHTLLHDGFQGHVTVFDALEGTGRGSTAYTAGGFRNLWTTPANMQLMNYSIARFKEFEAEFGLSIGFHQVGYLFTYYDKGFRWARDFVPTWQENDVRVELLRPDDIEQLIPGLRAGTDHIDPEVLEVMGLQEIAGGVFGPDCGVFDPTAVCQGYFDRSLEHWADRIEMRMSTRVAKILLTGDRVRGLELESGEVVEGDVIVLAAGAWVSGLLEKSGFSDKDNVPVDALKRMLFVTNLPPHEGYENIPLTIIDKGIYFRYEAGSLMIGRARNPQTPGFETEPELDYYINEINVYLQERVQGAERCRLVSPNSMWGGLYPECRLDHNGIIGWHPRCKGLMLACGFGGHGAMQAPATGKCVSELIRLGRYETVDASALDFLRFEENRYL
ncbi:MAG: FAD-binding oxidoreductase, partial [Planctomycetota bacterium]|nr:FAD-binding oxidoreductase [Planctomycetota bacterium]